MIDAQQAIAAYEHSRELSAELRATITSPELREWADARRSDPDNVWL